MKCANYLGLILLFGANACGGVGESQDTAPNMELSSLGQALTEATGPLCQGRTYEELRCNRSCESIGSATSCWGADECQWNGWECDGSCADWVITTRSNDDYCQGVAFQSCFWDSECALGGPGPVVATLYRDSYERGRISQLGPGMSQNLRNGNDSASSIRVASGYCVRVYRDTAFRGSSMLIRAGGHGVGNLNDEVSSWEVVDCPTPPAPPSDPCGCRDLPPYAQEGCYRSCNR